MKKKLKPKTNRKTRGKKKENGKKAGTQKELYFYTKMD
jgi:hypothetical protein